MRLRPMSDSSSVHEWLRGIEPGNDTSCKQRFHLGNAVNDHDSCSRDRSSGIPATRKRKRPLDVIHESQPLANITGNTTAPLRDRKKGRKEKENAPVTPQRSQRTGSQTSGAAEAGAQETDMEERAARNGPLDLEKARDLLSESVQRDAAYAASSPTRSSTTASSTRSKSPIKSMGDLRMAQRPTEPHRLDAAAAVEAGGVLVHYPRLVRISRGEAVIPHHLRKHLEQELPEAEQPPSWAYAPADDAISADVHLHQQSWGRAARTLNERATDCEQRGLTEANWNLKVHNPLLDLVVENPKYKAMVEQMNITHARIEPNSLSPVHLSGAPMQTKMVDLAILLRLQPDTRRQLRRVFECLPRNSQSVNQTMQDPLREEPIALNIETKTPFSGGDTADLQLAVWCGAGLARLRMLLEAQDRTHEEIPTSPMLSLHGHDLHLSAIEERVDHNRVYGKLRIGSTDSILGIFQMIAGVELLIDWANTDLRKWYEEKIFLPAE